MGGTKALLGDGQVYAGGPHHFLAMDEASGEVGESYIGGRQMVLADDLAYLMDGEKVFCVNRAEALRGMDEFPWNRTIIAVRSGHKTGFTPGSYQGVTMRPGRSPILDLQPQLGVSVDRQRRDLSLIDRLNQRHLAERDFDDRLNARVRAYELAFRMQAAAPALVDIRQETAATHRLYGIDRKSTREFGERCLLARRMIENGVRFVQLYSGDTNGWDAHSDVDKNHSQYCQRTDLPVAGLLTDLKQRGLLEDTLVIWGGEFGRMPMSEQGRGRDHNPWGYSVWLAGAGLRGGRAYGATDEIGLRAVRDKVSVNDFHATLLHLLGIDHNQLTWFHNGLDKRLTGPDEAHVVDGLLT